MACKVASVPQLGVASITSLSSSVSLARIPGVMDGLPVVRSASKRAVKRRGSVEIWSNFSLARIPSPVGVWQLDSVIGRGQFGVVYSAWNAGEQLTAAAKVVDVDEADSYGWSAARNEVCILQRYRHENLVKMYGAYREETESSRSFSTKCKLWVICDGGSVKHLAHSAVSNDSPLEEEIIRYILHETLQGLQYLHQNNVIHRDVKGSNILLTRKGDVKLVDFGVAAKFLETDGYRRRNSIVGTPHYMAPEVVFCEYQHDLDYDSRCDTWSLGVTAIQMAEGNPPMFDLSNDEIKRRIPRQKSPHLSDEDLWSTEFQDFISSCLVKDMEKRPHCRDQLDHPFIQQMDENTDNVKESLSRLIEKYSSNEASQSSFTSSSTRIKTGSENRKLMARIGSPPLEVVQEETSPISSPNLKRDARDAMLF
ncbi:myosin-IIIa-like isoform X2 [Corticium candelabrum]|uniref:myosin-IIIa-like isoform X2 n=1 Tax=Corticium candelabrum TaxID=121492 RepID=UPI002E261B87|nr:myosin-IIIa-like isoform X2 [Corticium candelabrum]